MISRADSRVTSRVKTVSLEIAPGYTEDRDMSDPDSLAELIKNLEDPIYPPRASSRRSTRATRAVSLQRPRRAQPAARRDRRDPADHELDGARILPVRRARSLSLARLHGRTRPRIGRKFARFCAEAFR